MEEATARVRLGVEKLGLYVTLREGAAFREDARVEGREAMDERRRAEGWSVGDTVSLIFLAASIAAALLVLLKNMTANILLALGLQLNSY